MYLDFGTKMIKSLPNTGLLIFIMGWQWINNLLQKHEEATQKFEKNWFIHQFLCELKSLVCVQFQAEYFAYSFSKRFWKLFWKFNLFIMNMNLVEPTCAVIHE